MCLVCPPLPLATGASSCDIFPMKKFSMRFIFTVLFFLVSMPFLALGDALKTSIRLGGSAAETRLVLDLEKSVNFNVTPPDKYGRLIIEIPRSSISNPTSKAFGYVKGFQFLPMSSDKTHLVVNTVPGASIKRFFLLKPLGPGKPHRLVVDIVKGADSVKVQPVSQPIPKPEIKKPVAPKVVPQKTETIIIKAKQSQPAQKVQKLNRKPIIAIDAGHGGRDPGTIGIGGVREKDVTLSMALELRKQLLSTGRFQVFMTRDRDIFLPLRTRVEKARKAKADLFISLHADSHPNPDTKGMCVYTLSKNRSDREAEKLAAKENKADMIVGMDLSTESMEVTNILIDLAQRESMNLSSHFAQGLVKSIQAGMRLPNRPHRFAGFAVLTAPDIPSVLIELGYLSNKIEAKNLCKASYRHKLSVLLKDAVDQYFQRRQI